MYINKYLKYKKKYIELKKMKGGASIVDKLIASLSPDPINEDDKNKLLDDKVCYGHIGDGIEAVCGKDLKINEMKDEYIKIDEYINKNNGNLVTYKIKDININIKFDDLYVTYTKDIINFTNAETYYDDMKKILKNSIIVDPADNVKILSFLNEKGMGAKYASGSLYYLYNITSGDLDIKKTIPENIDKNDFNNGYNLGTAVAQEYTRGTIIHVQGPSIYNGYSEKEWTEQVIITYTNIINLYLLIINNYSNEKNKILRFSLVSLGSFLPNDVNINDDNDKINFILDILLPNVFDRIDPEQIQKLDNRIYFALGFDIPDILK